MGLFAQRWQGRKAGVGYPAVGWAPLLGHSTTTSGVTVNQDKAFTIAAYYAGVRVISEDVAKLPLIVYRRNGRAKDRATDHRLYGILHDAPNPEMTSFVFRETLMAHLLTWGNAYAEKELNGSGQTLRLWPLRPDRMAVSLVDGKRKYEYTVKVGAKPIEIESKRVFHIPGLGFDGLIGYSPLHYARETLADIIGTREYGSRVLANDAHPGVILTHPNTLTDPARKNLEASWNDNHGGFSNAGRTAVLEEGITVTTLGLPRQDMLFLEARKFQISEVARWLRLAPHKIGDLERSTFSNIESQQIDYTSSTLQAWLSRWEQQIDKDLLPEPDLFAEHLLDAALRGTTLERYQAYHQAVSDRAMTPNEWRTRENMNPVEWGDEPVSSPNNDTRDPRFEDVGALIRAGFDPIASLAAVGLPPIVHTGLLPVTVQSQEQLEVAPAQEAIE